MSQKKIKILKGEISLPRLPSREFIDFSACFDWKTCSKSKQFCLSVESYLKKCGDLYYTADVSIKNKSYEEAANVIEVYICHIIRLMKQSKKFEINQKEDVLWVSTWRSFATTGEVSYRSQNFMFEIAMSCILLATLYYTIAIVSRERSKGTDNKKQYTYFEKAGWVFTCVSNNFIIPEKNLAPEYDAEFCKAMAELCFAQSELIKIRFNLTGPNKEKCNYEFLSKLASSCARRFEYVTETFRKTSMRYKDKDEKLSLVLLEYSRLREVSTKGACLSLAGMKLELEKKYIPALKYYQTAHSLLEEICVIYRMDCSEEAEKNTIGRQCFYVKKLLDSAKLWQEISSEKENVTVQTPEQRSGVLPSKWAPYDDRGLWPEKKKKSHF